MKLLQATALLCLTLFFNYGLALPVDSALEKGPGFVTGSLKGCSCFAPADACFSLNRTDITDNIPCFENLHLCLAGCSLPGHAWYNGTSLDEPKSHRNTTAPAKNVPSAGHGGSIEARLVEKRLTCLQVCYSTWNVCHGWATFFFSTYTDHIATCDYFFEYCATNNCHLPVQPRPALGAASKSVPADTSKAKRDPPFMVTVPGPLCTDCTTFCNQGWQICVALVNGSKGKFGMSGCDTYVGSCVGDCYGKWGCRTKRDLEMMSDVSLDERYPTPTVKPTGIACTAFYQQCWQICVALVHGPKGKFALTGCDKYEEGCINNCYTPVYPKTPPPKHELAPRAAVVPVDNNSPAEICNTHCGAGWVICVQLITTGAVKLPISDCGNDEQACQNYCWGIHKCDGGISESLVERDAAAATPVNAFAEVCDIHCGQAWAESVKLINSGVLKLPLSVVDDFTQQCIKNCWARKRDGGMSPSDVSLAKRGKAISGVSLGKRNPESGKQKCHDVCLGLCAVCGDLVKANWPGFSYPLCYEEFINCANKCDNDPFDDAEPLVPPVRRDVALEPRVAVPELRHASRFEERD